MLWYDTNVKQKIHRNYRLFLLLDKRFRIFDEVQKKSSFLLGIAFSRHAPDSLRRN